MLAFSRTTSNTIKALPCADFTLCCWCSDSTKVTEIHGQVDKTFVKSPIVCCVCHC